jgi:hypothetical protein
MMSEFWTSPFNFALGTEIKAKVVAVNSRGESIISDENTSGVTVQTVPL